MPDKLNFDALSFDKDGFARIPSLLDADYCNFLAAEFAGLQGAGVRHLIDQPAVISLFQHSSVVQLVQGVLGCAGFAYKATFFDKHAESNWLVAWHQDISIPVRQRLDVVGWSGWSRKGGVWYVQPPTDALSRLLALRINIDDCDNDNGPLRLLRGTHHLGRLKHRELAAHITGQDEEIVTGLRGSALLMRPLLIHASSKTIANVRRRVLHLEFANFELPAGLNWHRREAITSGG